MLPVGKKFYNIPQLKSTQHQRKKNAIFVENADCVDVITYLIASAVADDENFNKIFNDVQKVDKNYIEYINTYLEHGNRVRTYMARTKLLANWFQVDDFHEFKRMDCAQTLSQSIQMVISQFKDENIVRTIEEKKMESIGTVNMLFVEIDNTCNNEKLPSLTLKTANKLYDLIGVLEENPLKAHLLRNNKCYTYDSTFENFQVTKHATLKPKYLVFLFNKTDTLDGKLDGLKSVPLLHENDEKPEKPTFNTTKHHRSKNSILNKAEINCAPLIILKNGDASNGSNNRKSIVSTMTCSFDSISQIYFGAYVDFEWYNAEIRNKGSEYANFIVAAMETKAQKSLVYRLRNELLIKMFDVDEYERVIKVNCETFADKMFEKICEQDPHFNSITEVLSGKEPRHAKFVRFDLLNLDFENIEIYGYGIKNARCTTFNSIIVLDVEGIEKTAKLETISKDFEVNGQRFRLIGVVERQPNHFVAHVYRRNNRFETYDDMTPGQVQKTHLNANITCSLLFYCSDEK